MFDSLLGLIIVVGVVWLAIGVVLSVAMGRRGHSSFSWLVLGTLLGPLAVVLAIDSGAHAEGLSPTPVSVSAAERFGVDVVAGYDGSAESRAAIEAAAALLGDRLGRLAVVTVVPFDGGTESERLAKAGLQRFGGANPVAAPVTRLEVLHGRPADAIRQWASEEGYDLIAVGARGSGVAKRVLGSAAYDLARGGKVPVLVVGAQ